VRNNDASKQAPADKTVTVSLIIPIIAELYQKMNLIKCSSKAAQDAHDLIKIRIKERIASLLDPRFKNEGFFLPSNAEQAAKALELKLYEILSMNSNASSTAPAPPQASFYPYLQGKLSNKVTSNRADSIILMRQYFEQKNDDYYTGRLVLDMYNYLYRLTKKVFFR